MTEQEIFEKLQRIIAADLDIAAPIDGKTAVLADGVMDSMDFMNYMTRVEEVFARKISDDEISARKLGVVDNMVKFLAEGK